MAYPYYPNYQPYPQVNSMYNPVQASTTMYNDQRNQTHDERIFVQGRLAAEAQNLSQADRQALQKAMEQLQK